MRTVEELGIRVAALMLTVVTGLAMVVLAAPAGVVGVGRDALKSRT